MPANWKKYFPVPAKPTLGIHPLAYWLATVLMPILGIVLFSSSITSQEILAYSAIELMVGAFSLLQESLKSNEKLLTTFRGATWFMFVLSAAFVSGIIAFRSQVPLGIAISTAIVSVIASYVTNTIAAANDPVPESTSYSLPQLDIVITPSERKKEIVEELLFRKRVERLQNKDFRQLTADELENEISTNMEWMQEYEENSHIVREIHNVLS